MKLKLICTATVGLLAMSTMQAQSNPKPANTFTISQEAQENLDSIRDASIAARNDADTLVRFIAQLGVSNDSYYGHLASLRTEINRIGSRMAALQAESPALPAWQQKAIAQTVPLLQDAAVNTDQAIQYFDEHKSTLWTPANRAYAKKIEQDSQKVVKILGDYLKLAKLNGEVQHVDNDLAIVGGA